MGQLHRTALFTVNSHFCWPLCKMGLQVRSLMMKQSIITLSEKWQFAKTSFSGSESSLTPGTLCLSGVDTIFNEGVRLCMCWPCGQLATWRRPPPPRFLGQSLLEWTPAICDSAHDAHRLLMDGWWCSFHSVLMKLLESKQNHETHPFPTSVRTGNRLRTLPCTVWGSTPTISQMQWASSSRESPESLIRQPSQGVLTTPLGDVPPEFQLNLPQTFESLS